MANEKLIHLQLLSEFWDGFKEVINNARTHMSNTTGNPHNVTALNLGLENVENKSSATIRNELTYNNIINGLGYIPAEASDLSIYKFDIINGDLNLTYPDDSPAPDVHISSTGELIWSYVE